VIVNLGKGRTVSGKVFPALSIGLDNALVYFGFIFLYPGKERRSEVEAYSRVVIDNIDDLLLCIENAGCRIGGITLCCNSLVPVVIGIGRVLLFDLFQPGIFSRRLIKMAVDTDRTINKKISSREKIWGFRNFWFYFFSLADSEM
jgi:hypothetical protein